MARPCLDDEIQLIDPQSISLVPAHPEKLFLERMIPRATLGYTIRRGGSIERAYQFFCKRLEGVGQLGKLVDPYSENDRTRYRRWGMPYHHNRATHSMDVAAFMRAMCRTVGIVAPWEVATGYAGGMSHDTKTPAWGDGIMFVSPHFLSEERRFPRALQGPEWIALRDAWDINEELLVDMVQTNRGRLGTMLDLADRLGYLASDVDEYLSRRTTETDRERTYCGGYGEITAILQRRPDIFALWKTVTLVGDEVVVQDAPWLADVLTIRALMFRHLYYHPTTGYVERLMGGLLVRDLIERKKLRPGDLFTMTDKDLDAVVEHYFGDVHPFLSGGNGHRPDITFPATIDEARNAEWESINNGSATLSFIAELRPVKPATGTLVLHNGRVQALRDALPDAAARIEAIAKAAPHIHFFRLGIPYLELPWPLRQLAWRLRKRTLKQLATHTLPFEEMEARDAS